ncbi:hypothetical protein RMQ97_04460 [Maricaulis sp. D1M11]|uniref:hypothetical protein n=1 Tax=Maricaulis sp. D1M11 TaxID=3076117 RepID=UPI0039B4C952
MNEDDDLRDALFEQPEDPVQHERGRLWLNNGVLLSLLLVAALNPVSMERWAAAKAPNWGIETIRLTTQVWSQRMQLLGLNTPRDAIETWWDGLQGTGWHDIRLPRFQEKTTGTASEAESELELTPAASEASPEDAR